MTIRDKDVSRRIQETSKMARIPDPTTNPKGPGFTQASVLPVYPGMQHVLNSSSVVSVQVGGTYWEISVTFPDMTADEFLPLDIFLAGLQGAFSPFEIQLPQFANPKNGALTTPLAGVLQAAAGDTLVIYNWDNIGGSIVAGDMLKLSNSNKIYRILSTSIVVGGVNSGVATIKLNFPLAKAVTTIDKIQPNNILFRVKLKSSDVPASNLGSNGLYKGFALGMRESIL